MKKANIPRKSIFVFSDGKENWLKGAKVALIIDRDKEKNNMITEINAVRGWKKLTSAVDIYKYIM